MTSQAIYTRITEDAVHLQQKEMARGAWAEGQVDNAHLIIDAVLSEELSAEVAVECWITKATFCADQGRWIRALECLESAAPYLDSASLYLQGTFFQERARAHKALGHYDSALMDYAGASDCFEQVGHVEYQAAVENNLAGLYLKCGKALEAHAHIDKAIGLLTNLETEYLGQAFDTQAEIFANEGNLKAALQSANRAVELIDENLAWRDCVLITRGKIRTLLGDTSARDDFDTAINNAEGREDAYTVGRACSAAILSLPLPIEDLIAYYNKADALGQADLTACARKIIGQAVPVGTVEEMQFSMIRRALWKYKGRVTQAAQSIGMSHRGIAHIIEKHPQELAHLREPPRIRRTSIATQNKTRKGKNS